jgi:hypothetical protein
VSIGRSGDQAGDEVVSRGDRHRHPVAAAEGEARDLRRREPVAEHAGEERAVEPGEGVAAGDEVADLAGGAGGRGHDVLLLERLPGAGGILDEGRQLAAVEGVARDGVLKARHQLALGDGLDLREVDRQRGIDVLQALSPQHALLLGLDDQLAQAAIADLADLLGSGPPLDPERAKELVREWEEGHAETVVGSLWPALSAGRRRTMDLHGRSSDERRASAATAA